MSGPNPPCAGPMKSVIATTRSSVYLAMKHIFPEAPINAGTFAPLHIADPDGTSGYFTLGGHDPAPGSDRAGHRTLEIPNRPWPSIGDRRSCGAVCGNRRQWESPANCRSRGRCSTVLYMVTLTIRLDQKPDSDRRRGRRTTWMTGGSWLPRRPVRQTCWSREARIRPR